MLGLVLLYVGAVLLLNGIWLLGRIDDREIAVINFFAGVVAFLVAVTTAFRADADLVTIRGSAFTLLFAFTYLWVGINRFLRTDGRGLGWFCLFVAITAVPVAFETLRHAAGNTWQIWFGLSWAAWAVLWFLYFLLLVPQQVGARLTGIVTIVIAILTAWLPAYLLLTGRLA